MGLALNGYKAIVEMQFADFDSVGSQLTNRIRCALVFDGEMAGVVIDAEVAIEPIIGTTGWTSLLINPISASTVGRDTAERPAAKRATRATIIARTSACLARGPTPTARASGTRCWAAASGAMRVSTAAPRPVLTP